MKPALVAFALGLSFSAPSGAFAEYCGELACVQQLVSVGSDLNASQGDAVAETALHYAARDAHLDAVKFLVEHGARVDVTDSLRQTPLHQAAAGGRTEVVAYLLAHGAGMESRDRWGFTPLSLAIVHNHLDTARVLIERGADVNAENALGDAPLHQAAMVGNVLTARYLFEHGARINAVNGRGWTALHTASGNGHPEVIDFLIQHGINVQAVNKNSQTAAHMACRFWENPSGPCPTADILRALGAADAAPAGGPSSCGSDVDEPKLARAPRPHDFAVVIGIEKYQGKNLPRAEFAECDANAMAAHLRALGVPGDHVKLLTGDGATSIKIKQYLESWLPKNVKPDSRVYFYFSGHGAPDPAAREAYLVPWDGDPEYLAESAWSLADVYKKLGRLDAKEVFVALDSCFSGAGGRSIIKDGVRPLVNLKGAGEGLPPKITLLAASQGNQITNSLKSRRHGIFTYYLLQGLNSGAKDSKALCGFLDPKVRDAAALQNSEQKPACLGPDVAF